MADRPQHGGASSTPDPVDIRVAELLSTMSVAQKAALTAGSDAWHTTGLPELGVPRMKLSDGPCGVRGGGSEMAISGTHGITSACFPSASCLAATWDPELMGAVGRALGEEAKTKGAHVVLGPTINLHRSPLGGRHFECFSEDPYLTARLAVGYVRGLQSQGVAACAKHFVCNDSEFERMTISSEVDERALREVHLQPFEAVVKEAGIYAIMAAYNRINGKFATEHTSLVSDLLKAEWRFGGVVMSDWYATHSTVGAAIGGTDLEMPGPPVFFGPALSAECESGGIPESFLTDKAHRVLRLLAFTGALDGSLDTEPAETSVDRPEHRALARQAATAGCVLLKNTEGALPLRLGNTDTLAVVGPNAEQTSVLGGGSSQVRPHYTTSVLAALQDRGVRDGFTVAHAPGCTNYRLVPTLGGVGLQTPRGQSGVECTYFASDDCAGPPAHQCTMEDVDLTWGGDIATGVDPRSFSARFRCSYTPTTDGPHLFSLQCAGRARLRVDGAVLLDNWTDPVRGESWFGFGTREETAERVLVAGVGVAIEVDYSAFGTPVFRGVRLGLAPVPPEDLIDRAVAVAATAAAVVVVVGLSAEWETEGHDKAVLELPGRQAELVEKVAAVCPRTVVVLNTGGPVAMSKWVSGVPAVLQAWYGGQEAGNAVADVLLGDVDPGGRLPTTIPRALTDVPCHANGDPTSYPGEAGRVVYTEGLWGGYKGYQRSGIAPLYPFGHGLSYADIAITGCHAPATVPVGSGVDVSVEVQNRSNRGGVVVVQVYLEHEAPRLPRPSKELGSFHKAFLRAGEASKLQLSVAPRALAFWDPAKKRFMSEEGTFRVHVGLSSADIALVETFRVGAGDRQSSL